MHCCTHRERERKREKGREREDFFASNEDVFASRCCVHIWGSSTNISICVCETIGYFYVYQQNFLCCLHQANRFSHQNVSLFYIVILGHTGCNYPNAAISICSRALVQISSCILQKSFCGSDTDNWVSWLSIILLENCTWSYLAKMKWVSLE